MAKLRRVQLFVYTYLQVLHGLIGSLEASFAPFASLCTLNPALNDENEAIGGLFQCFSALQR